MKELHKNVEETSYEEYTDGKPNWKVVGPLLAVVIAIILYMFI